jgi:DNA-binding Xre family transcriptional regulator
MCSSANLYSLFDFLEFVCMQGGVGCMVIGTAIRLRILDICGQRNMTVNKLSTVSGITQSTLNNIVSGRNRSATVSTIKKICDGLDVTIIDFFDDDLFRDLEQEIY